MPRHSGRAADAHGLSSRAPVRPLTQTGPTSRVKDKGLGRRDRVGPSRGPTAPTRTHTDPAPVRGMNLGGPRRWAPGEPAAGRVSILLPEAPAGRAAGLNAPSLTYRKLFPPASRPALRASGSGSGSGYGGGRRWGAWVPLLLTRLLSPLRGLPSNRTAPVSR